MLVGLRLVEPADDGPDDLRRRVDSLRVEGGAAPRAEVVGVELGDGLRELRSFFWSQLGRHDGDGETLFYPIGSGFTIDDDDLKLPLSLYIYLLLEEDDRF